MVKMCDYCYDEWMDNGEDFLDHSLSMHSEDKKH